MTESETRGKRMSQINVEILIGRLATDEEFRARFAKNRVAALAGFVSRGHALTPSEITALLATNVGRCEDFAADIDPRIQKASLKESR
jgi:hypothetical protein